MANIAAELKNGAASVWNGVSKTWAGLLAGARKALGMKGAASEPAGAPAAGPQHNGALARLRGWAFLPAHVLENDDAVIVRIDAPGMRRDDFTIEFSERSLKVRGVRPTAQHGRTGRWQVSQWAHGSFCRYFVLKSQVRSAQGSAVYRDGVLRIAIPKAGREATATHIPLRPH